MIRNLLSKPIRTKDNNLPEDITTIEEDVVNDANVKLRFYYLDNLQRWSLRLLYVRPYEIIEGRNEEAIAVFKVNSLPDIFHGRSNKPGDGVVIEMNGGEHPRGRGANNQVCIPFEGGLKKVFQKEPHDKHEADGMFFKCDGDDDDIYNKRPEDLGNIVGKDYFVIKVTSINKGRNRQLITAYKGKVDNNNHEPIDEWDIWLEVEDDGHLRCGGKEDRIPVIQRTWHNWIRVDGADIDIPYFAVRDW